MSVRILSDIGRESDQTVDQLCSVLRKRIVTYDLSFFLSDIVVEVMIDADALKYPLDEERKELVHDLADNITHWKQSR